VVAPARRLIRIPSDAEAAAAVRAHAIALATEFGYAVFPSKPNKQPYTAHGFKDATTNAEQIAAWWRRFPDALIGVPTGSASGVFILDIDPAGRRWYATNSKRLLCSRIHETRRGRHLVYRMPDTHISCSAGRIAPGVDVRADGGYIIYWPAHGLRATGDLLHLSLPPDWLSESALNRRLDVSDSQRAGEQAAGDLVGEGGRNEFLSRKAYGLRKQGLSAEQIFQVLRAFNDARCVPPLSDAELQQIARGKDHVRPDSGPDAEIKLHLLRASDVVMEPTSWLWPEWLARGKLHMLGGVPGTGKTSVALSLAATVSAGGTWPDGTACREAANVIIWSGEDGIADTLTPRLTAMGADLGRVHFVSDVTQHGVRRLFDPARDMPALIAGAREVGSIGLLIVDPVVTAISGDSHKNSEVRRGLATLVEFAEKHNAAVLGITHFSKGTTDRDPLDRLTGSLAFGAAPRLVFAAAKQPSTDKGAPERVLVRVKSNIGKHDGGGFRYGLESSELPEGITTSRVIWGGSIDGTAREILAEAESTDSDGGQTALADAEEFLRQELSMGSRPGAELGKRAGELGISWATLRRAQKALGIKPRKEGMQGGWVWELPPKALICAEGAQEKG
jgi:putative DNA primase/helicase